MALVNAYTSVADVRAHLEDGGSKLSTVALEQAINASSRAIDRYTGRRFWADATVVTRTYTANDQCLLLVDDIASRTGVIVKTGTDGTAFPTTWAATDFTLEPRNADVTAGTADAYAFWQIAATGARYFPCYGRRSTVSVTARFGWSAVPDDVTEACILKAASLFARKDAPFGVAGFNEFGVVRIGRNDPDVTALLAGYVNPVAG